MDIQLRPAQIDDLSEIQDLFVGTINEVCAPDYSDEQLRVWTSAVQDLARWTYKLSSQYFLLATAGDKIVGFGSLENHDHIDFMYISKDFQRHGIASKIFSALEAEARRFGAAVLRSDVSKTARGFFEKKGFKVVAAQTRIIDHVEISNYRMEKYLIDLKTA